MVERVVEFVPRSEIEAAIQDRRKVTHLLASWSAVLSVLVLLAISCGTIGFLVASHSIDRQDSANVVRASNSHIFCQAVTRLESHDGLRKIDCAALERAIHTNKPVPPGLATVTTNQPMR